MSGTTLDSGLSADSGLLARLSNPPHINYLDIQNSAAETGQRIWQNRILQAHQAAGEAYQQATNPETGEVDAGRAQAIMARDPRAALAAQGSATTGQALRGANMGFNQQQMGMIGRSVGSVLALPDDQQTPDNYRAALDLALKQGAITQSHHDAAIANLPSGGDPRAMRNYGTRLLVGTLAGPEMANTVLPRWQMPDTGRTLQPQIVQPPTAGGAVTNAPGATTKTTSPETGAQLVSVYEKVTDPKTGAVTYQETKVPRDQLPGANAPASSTFPNGGRIAPPPGLANPDKPPPGAAPAPPSATAGPSPPVASGTPPAAAPAPAPPILAAPPQGQPQTLETDIGLRTKAATDMGGMQKRLIAGQSALDALDMARTGPGTANESHMLAFLQAHNYAPPPKGQMSDTEYRQILVKNLLRFAQDSGRTAGTDLGLETQIHSNANADEMLKGANRHVLLQDLGILKRDIAQTEEMPAPSGEGAIREHIAKFPANTDPRAFMIDHLPPEEQKALLDEAKKQGPNGKIYRSLEIAHRRGYITPPSQSAPAAAPPPPPSSAPPKATAGRPLAMAPTNYLAMA